MISRDHFCLSCISIFRNERNWIKKSARVSEKLISPGLSGLQVATRLAIQTFRKTNQTLLFKSRQSQKKLKYGNKYGLRQQKKKKRIWSINLTVSLDELSALVVWICTKIIYHKSIILFFLQRFLRHCSHWKHSGDTHTKSSCSLQIHFYLYKFVYSVELRFSLWGIFLLQLMLWYW